MTLRGFALALLLIPSFAPASAQQTVSQLDLARYMGDWYEIGSIPVRFQKDCVGTLVHYKLRDDGKVEVINTCKINALDGRLNEAKGKAWIPDPSLPGRLKVMFFWPFRGDYWILEVGKDYEYAVVGHPKMQYLWILSRKPEMEEGLYQGILKRCADWGYDIGKLKKTLQRVPGGDKAK